MNSASKKQEEAVRKILAKSKVNAEVAVGALRFPAHCRQCGRELREEERMRFDGLCFECAKNDVITFRERAIKKYVTAIIIWVIIEVVLTFVASIENQILSFILKLLVALIIDSCVIYVVGKLLAKKRRADGLNKPYKVGNKIGIAYAFGGLALFLIAFIIMTAGSLVGVFLLAGICYIIFRDFEEYKKRKAAVEKFGIEERRRERAAEDAKVNEEPLSQSETEPHERAADEAAEQSTTEDDVGAEADLTANDWNI